MTDHLGQLLAELPVPASAEARDRTIAAARAATPTAPAPALRPSRRRGAIAAAAVVLGLALASPPGQAAIDKLGELVGIGDVGAPPTLGPDDGVIVDNGRAPDGTGYEWNAYPAGTETVPESCIRLDWPASNANTGGITCSAFPDSSASPWGPHYLSQFEVRRLDSGDVMLTGVTTREPHSLRILLTGAGGREQQLPVDFARVEGERLARAGAQVPFGVFTAFVPAELAQRSGLDRFRDLGLLGPKFAGPEPTPDPSQPPECSYDAPPGPFEYRFYGADGGLLDRVPTIVGRIAPAGCKP